MQSPYEDLERLLGLGVSPDEVARLAATEYRLAMLFRYMGIAGITLAGSVALMLLALKMDEVDPAKAPAVMRSLMHALLHGSAAQVKPGDSEPPAPTSVQAP